MSYQLSNEAGPYEATRRDRFAVWASNFILTRVATIQYLAYLYLVVDLGKKELARKLKEG